MTSRIHAPRTWCPGCHEEVYLEELVEGRCPLCGFSVDDLVEGGEPGELIDHPVLVKLMAQYFFFKKLDQLGASPGNILEVITAFGETEGKESNFSLEVPVGRLDFLAPKRCAGCGRIFFRTGKKTIRGDLMHPGLTIASFCRRCALNMNVR